MKFRWFKSKLFIFVLIVLLGAVGYVVFKYLNPSEPDWITATVERGDVQEIVSVSGYVEAKNTAELAFPTTGVVTDVFAEEGTVVRAGEVLATLAASQLVAQRNEAAAALAAARADYSELVAGPSESERNVTAQSVINAEQNLNRTITLENEKVTNARSALLSSGLAALSTDPEENATAPTVTGTYTCEDEGDYTITIYRSGGQSGYSYRYEGLETGTGIVTTDQPNPMGSCGLYLQFTDGDFYNNSEWVIKIPNKKSATYVTYKNAYDLAIEARTAAIAAAEDALTLAQKEAGLANAAPRTESVNKSQAAVSQAIARIAAIDAQIADRSIVAPFDGVVTDIDVVSGETAGATPVITMLANNAFELRARIPEIDITRVLVGQTTDIVFDAKSDQTLTGEIEYISPLAVEIDGVAYFNARIGLEESPEWLRSGLNADIDIIINEVTDVLRLPNRFVITEDNEHFVLTPKDTETKRTAVTTGFEGNDGFIEVTSLNEGATVVAP